MYHALNGIRIMRRLLDKGPRYQKQMIWAMRVWVVVMVPGAYFLLRTRSQLFGSSDELSGR